MENLFNQINNKIKKDGFKEGSHEKSSTKVNFYLNNSGNYYYTITKYCAGITLSIDLSILNPNDIYTIRIRSSDGGNHIFENVKSEEVLHCKLKTSFWYSTKFTVEIHALNSRNIESQALVRYTY